MRVKRIEDFNPLQRLCLKKIWPFIENTPKDGALREIKATLIYGEYAYEVKCDFILIRDYLQIKQFEIIYEGKVIHSENSPIKVGPAVHQEIYLDKGYH